MGNFKKDYKKLYRCYDRRLKHLHKKNFSKLTANMDYFVTNLQFMRDYYILTEDLMIGDEENLKVSAIATAIAEYDSYKNCVQKYFDSTGKLLPTWAELSREEILKKYAEEKAYHWQCFWQLVTLNMESWTNDTI